MNILTFDIEDWYNHDDYSQDFEWDKFEVRLYEGVDKILEALDRRHLRGTFFCLGWVAEKHPAIIRRIADGGHQIGCHSYQHQLATRFTPAQFEQDTGKAKKLLEDIAGREVNAYRVPSFSITRNNLWAFDLLAKLGFRYDCSVFLPARIRRNTGIPLFPLPYSDCTRNVERISNKFGKLSGEIDRIFRRRIFQNHALHAHKIPDEKVGLRNVLFSSERLRSGATPNAPLKSNAPIQKSGGTKKRLFQISKVNR